MKIYDKAQWHTDAGENENIVLARFNAVFTFCPAVNNTFALVNSGFAIKNSSVDKLLLNATWLISSPNCTVYFFCASNVPNSKYLLKSFAFVKILSCYL